MQNKANLKNNQMDVKSSITRDYEKKLNWTLGENKPKQSQFQRQINATAKIEPAQSVVICFLLTPQPPSAIIKTVKTLRGIISLSIRRSPPEAKSLWVENRQINKLHYVFIKELK